jgi:hypothetical protein
VKGEKVRLRIEHAMDWNVRNDKEIDGRPPV